MGVLALGVFIAVTVIVNVVLKRRISEALVLALIACSLVGGADALNLLSAAVVDGFQSDVTFAGMAFVFMGVIVSATGLIERLIHILNSMFGRVRGGSAYVSTLGSAAIGLVAGSTAGNTATVGSVTIPWMKENGWSSNRAATLVAGNSGLGVALPPNSTMFILLAMPAAAGISAGDVYVALAIGGAYCVLYRMILVFTWARADGIPVANREGMATLGQALREGWRSLLIFLGIAMPVALTFGPLFEFLSRPELVGKDSMGSISIIVWVPILISAIALIEGRKRIFAPDSKFKVILNRELPQFATVGVSLFAALSASNIMEALGVGPQLSDFLGSLDMPKAAIVAIVCVMAVVVATPLSSTATAAAVGAPAVMALTSVGIDPVIAVVTVLLCTSTEGSSPPVGAPIYLAAGFAETNPTKMFMPLLGYFVLPMIVIAWLVGMGWLPIPIS